MHAEAGDWRIVERTLVVGSVVVALVLVPIMLTIGSLTYARLADRGEQQARSRYATEAVLTENAPARGGGLRGEAAEGSANVRARWQLRDGTTRTGPIEVDDGLSAGTKVTIWLDQDGRPVTAPLAKVQAALAGALVAVIGWLIGAGLLAVNYAGTRRLLDHCRSRAWQHEWARVGPEWAERYR